MMRGVSAVVTWPVSTNQGQQRAQPSQEVCLITENRPGSIWAKVSEQLVQQRSLSVPIAPLYGNEWPCLITGAVAGAASLLYKGLKRTDMVPESKAGD